MDFNEITGFLSQNMLILTPALYILGNFLKNTPRVKDWTIPWLLTGVSILFAMLVGGLKGSSLLQGIIAAGVTVLANQLVKQTLEK